MKTAGKEIVVLEDTEQRQIYEEADANIPFADSFDVSRLDAKAAQIIRYGRQDDQGKKAPVPRSVKDVTRDQQHPVLPAMAQDDVERENDGEEDRELV